MAKMIGPRKIHSYGQEFKATAVKLSHLPGVQVKDVAEALDIHPFMLSRWRKEYREGIIVDIGKSKRLQRTVAFPKNGCHLTKWRCKDERSDR